MTYEITTQVQELAKLRGVSEEEIVRKYGYVIKGSMGYWKAFNRRSEYGINDELSEARETAKKAAARKAFEKKLASGAVVWRKVGAEWLVQVTGREVAEGELIDVARRDGSTSTHRVSAIVARRDDGIYCRV